MGSRKNRHQVMPEENNPPIRSGIQTVLTLEIFDSLSVKWVHWLERFENSLQLAGVDGALRKHYLIHYIGKEAYEILSTKIFPEKPGDISYDIIKKSLSDYYDPALIEIAENYKFQQRRQRPGETVKDYLTALQALAINCNFGHYLETALRNQLVFGIHSRKTLEELLRVKDLTLKKTMEIATSKEISEKASLELHRESYNEDVQAVKTYGRPGAPKSTYRDEMKNKPKGNCYRCGRSSHLANSCLFKSAICHQCGKQGHLQAVCRSQGRRVQSLEDDGEKLHEYTGYKPGRSPRPYLKLATCLIFVSFISALYMLGDFTSIGYIEIIRRTENIDKTSYFTYINLSESASREGYLVWSPSCRIPDIYPWHESIRQFVKGGSLPDCGRSKSRVSRREEKGGRTLTVDDGEMTCCYSLITRKDMPRDTASPQADDVFTIGKCVDFKHNVTFYGEEQFVKIICRKQGFFKSKTNAYTNMHAFVTKTAAVQKKIQRTAEIKNRHSVMFFGIDSISRLNLFRTMPHTVEYLNNQGWLNFKGYNKIDDNTFPNLMAILTGYTLAQLRATCYGKNLDRCPIIWKDFSKQGYITAYAEDEPTIGSFNYHKSGFVITPTDYYLRPFMLAAEKLQLKKKDSLKVCLGPTPAADHIIDYAVDFADNFQDNPSFSLFWMNSFSHNDVNTPSAMDNRILKFFNDLEKTGSLNNTIVIFLSDHGIRFGKIRETYIGWIEERLPFIYFWIPESFKKAYPEKYHSLKTNADRLTSPHDIHVTLQELLGVEVNGTKACPKCQTLFQDVPWNRSCEDAGITEHWCTCAEYKKLSTESGPVRNIARFVLEHLNSLLDEGKSHLVNGTKCAPLTIHKILSLRSKVFSKKFSSHEEYVILFETLPGEALFEATVAHKNTFKLMDTVSRINAYGGQSKCMKDSFLQKYCYCQKM